MNMTQRIIAVDVDEVCCDLIGPWLAAYNRDFQDNLLPENIAGWDMATQVKPECGKGVYKYLRPPYNLYETVLPIPGARQAVYRISAAGHRVVFVSSCPQGTVDMKTGWLQKWGFLPKDSITAFVACEDKSLIRADLLVDDHIKNVEGFQGPAFLVTRPHNASLPCKRPRVAGLHIVADMVEAGAF